MSVNKVPGTDKNDNNTLLIVQDLIKDVICKVEQHINNSKMELMRNSATQQINDAIESDDTTNTFREVQKSEPLPTSLDGGRRNSSLQQRRPTTAAETEKVSQNPQPPCSPSSKNAIGLNTVKERSKMVGISNDINKADTDYFHEKTGQVEMDIFSNKRNSIPNDNFDLQSRKAMVKVMESDVVIPIFNVCSTIPKRDLVKHPPNKSNLTEAFQSTANRLSEPDSKETGCGTKTNDEKLIKGKNKDVESSVDDIADVMSNNHCEDLKSHERVSQELTYLNEAFERRTPVSESFGSAVTECPSQTGVPKLPPRKRFLVKIPKPGQSNEQNIVTEQDKPADSQNLHICDKQETKVLQEGNRILQENEKQERQMLAKDLSAASFTGERDKIASICSDDDMSLTLNKTEVDASSSPKVSQRKSRRDCSRRSLSFNSKMGVNRESSHISSSNDESFHVNKEYAKITANTNTKELNDFNTVNAKRIETTEVLEDATHLPRGEIDQSNNSTLEESISPRANDEKECLNLKEYSEKPSSVKWVETLYGEVRNMDIPRGNGDLSETEKKFILRYEANEVRNLEWSRFCDVKDSTGTEHQEIVVESKQSKPLSRPKKQRSLSRTRAMSMEFESLAFMPVRVVGPPRKPPGKVEIPKTFDPTQPVTSPKIEMKEIIFIPTACVSENKEKIQKKIEKVKKAAIVIPPRRKSDAGAASRKKKYTRSKTDFIPRGNDLAVSQEDENLTMEEMQRDSIYQEAIFQNEETASSENMDGDTVSNEMWYSAISPDTEIEECEQGFKSFGDQSECTDNFEGFYNENDVTSTQNNHQHRHSVDTESGYWTPPEMAACERFRQTNMKLKDERIYRKYDNSEKLMLQRAAFKNSKLRMKLSDEGLDMCSLSSSLESGIYSWRQEDVNGKRISPENESSLKVLSSLKFAEMASDGIYAPIARSFKKMSFPPEHSSTSELSENCSIPGDEKIMITDVASFGKSSRVQQCLKQNGVDSKPIKPSDSQSSYGSNDISDDVFESWVDKEDVVFASKEKSELPDATANRSSVNENKSNRQDKKARNWQRGEAWHSYSTDKESSDNDDDLDLMIDESHQAVYGTEGLWQFLKSVNQHLSDQLNTATQKMLPKPACHRSKSQESKHPDDMISEKRPVARSLSREERQRKSGTQLRHFVSEGKLTNADSIDCLEDTYARFNDTRYSSGYMASGSSLEDSGMTQKDFMSSADSFQNHSDDISIYGTLRRDKYFHSSSALSSPCLTRGKKSLQNLHSSVDQLSMYDNGEDFADDELLKHSEQNRRLSLYGTLRPKHLSQQGRAQSQILLSTDDGYQLLYNERLKKDPCSETRYGSLGALGSSVNKASSELNVSVRESQVKDYEKLLLTDPSIANRNPSSTDSSYHTAGDKVSSKAKKISSDKGMRRVSFSSDVKASKSDYHSSLRLNSLNKVREANEELHSSANPKSNAYDDEQDSGSLLEALKTYGYRGIMSQKLQSSPDKYEPRLNYRLPPECYLSTGFNKTGWEDVEYVPVESTLAYQQSLYSPVDPMEYYHSKAFIKGSQMKRTIGEYVDLPYEDDTMFKDIFRNNRLGESDTFNRRKSKHKFQDLNDLHLAHSDRYAGGNWDAPVAKATRKKSFDRPAAGLNCERRNSGSEKAILRDKDSEEVASTVSTEHSESHGSKQTENSIEILSGKIQALKSRCQRKTLDESVQKKQLDESEIPSEETQDCEKTASFNADSERLGSCYSDLHETLSTLENESSESVSDRIWRKSFYSRFNDVSTTRRKKSSLLDSEYLSGHSSFRGAGKFNIDEEGGVEEPWLHTSLKRRNSQHSRTLPRQMMSRTSSLSSDAKADYADSSSKYYKRGASESDTEYKSSLMTERRSLSQSNLEGHSTSVDKKLVKGESQNANKMGKTPPSTSQNVDCSDHSALLQGSRTDVNEFVGSSVTSRNNLLMDVSPSRTKCERNEDLGNRLGQSKCVDIPETQHDIIDGGSTEKSGVTDSSVSESKPESPSPENSAPSPPSAELNTALAENSEKQSTEENLADTTSADVINTQNEGGRLEIDRE